MGFISGIKSTWDAISAIRAKLGLDGAVVYTFCARILNITSSTGTVLLVIRYLNATEQGYYYTLLSLISLQVIFELGFSFVILQLAAHESVHLKLNNNGRVEGDAIAHARLASILQLTIRWYFRAAIVLTAVLIPAGTLFFSLKASIATSISTTGPVVLGVLAVSLSFALSPLYSFFEGCNQIRQVAFVRMCQSVAVLAASWSAIASGQGLYTSAAVNFAVVCVGAMFLFRRRYLISALLRHPITSHAVSWRTEIWPFQWKIAVSWFCSYFTLQVFTPILFWLRGPLEAGRIGLSLSITGYLPIIALCWVNTKAATFGRLVRLGRVVDLDALFIRTLKQSTVIILTLACTCFGAVLLIRQISPHIGLRMETPTIFVLLLITSISNFIIQSLGVYLRSFKREPYLLQSVVISGLTVLSTLVFAPRWGDLAVAVIYFNLSGAVASIWAITTFRHFRSTQVLAANRSEFETSVQANCGGAVTPPTPCAFALLRSNSR